MYLSEGCLDRLLRRGEAADVEGWALSSKLFSSGPTRLGADEGSLTLEQGSSANSDEGSDSIRAVV